MRIEGQEYLSADRISRTFIVLCVFASLLAGCASPTTFEGMVPTTFDTAKQHLKSVSVAVSGGQETDAIGKPQISNATFTQALVESITKSKVFSRIVQDKGVDYLLTVTLFSMEQPSFGFSFTVKMEAGWMLKRVDTGVTVWQKAIRSEFTASAGDAFAAVVRLRLATEGAARQNIFQGISEISKLAL